MSRTLASVLVGLAASLLALPAWANGGGVAGYTGKPNLSAPQGESCNQCHSGGTAPQVTLTGPATLTAGQVADYTLVVSTGQSRAAGAVAATDGVVLTPGTGFRDSFGEMVQNAALIPSGGQASFKFKVTAPLTGTTLKLWAVGLAASGAGTGGDRAAHVTRDIAITGGGTAPKPDAGTGTSSSSSSSSGGSSSGGTTADGGASTPTGTTSSGSSGGVDDPTTPANEADPDADDPTTADGRRSGLSGGDAGGCTTSPASRGGSAILAGMIAIACLASFRRRRPR